MSTCQSCSKPIVWAKNEATGKKLPLERTMHVYLIQFPGEAGNFVCKQAKQEVYISHFLTCPDAKKYSGRNK